MKTIKILGVLLLLLICVGLSGCVDNSENENDFENINTYELRDDINNTSYSKEYRLFKYVNVSAYNTSTVNGREEYKERIEYVSNRNRWMNFNKNNLIVFSNNDSIASWKYYEEKSGIFMPHDGYYSEASFFSDYIVTQTDYNTLRITFNPIKNIYHPTNGYIVYEAHFYNDVMFVNLIEYSIVDDGHKSNNEMYDHLTYEWAKTKEGIYYFY